MVGQAEGLPPWLAGSTTLTGTFILGWFVWHTVTKTIPELQTLFREELKNERENYGKLLADKDDRHERQINSLQKMLTESLVSDRRAVHDTRDVAQAVISQTELLMHQQGKEKDHSP